MPALRVLAIDDEPLALRRIALSLAQIDDVALIGQASTGRGGLELARSLRPDVVLLDVEMAPVSGFDLVEQMGPEPGPLVIFVSAHEGFAVRAFSVGAIDYLLKPFKVERLRTALARAGRTLTLARDASRAAESGPSTTTYASGFWVLSRGLHVRTSVQQIEWMEAERDYVRLHTRDEAFLMRGPLAALQEELDPSQFMRIHRSTVVRTDRIEAIRNRSSRDVRIVMIGGEELRVGKTYLADVRSMLSRR
ncbi:MAG: LytTR family DNA-binding domain-containing protein [Pseudomonadota bacterium]